MSNLRSVEPVIRFVAVIASDEQVRTWAYQKISQHWGEIIEISPAMPFEAGGYYTPAMGPNLMKTIVALATVADPAGLADWKTETNGWEKEAAANFAHDCARPLNLDPGYITQAKLVLATVKDRDHRLYLKDGIFAEVTLNYVGKQWVFHRWTYPDYRTPEVFEFAMACRKRLRQYIAHIDGYRRGKRE